MHVCMHTVTGLQCEIPFLAFYWFFYACSQFGPCLLPRSPFVEDTESVSTSGNKSKGEDMDACLEKVNKDSKVWQHGSIVALNWLRIYRNLENLSKVCKHREMTW